MRANNRRQTDAALPTTADMSSPHTCEAGVTRQPAETASRAFSIGYSITDESIDIDPGDPGAVVTTCPTPSSSPAVPTLIDEQQRWWREGWIESLQRDGLESVSCTPREVRETRHIIPSANNTRQTDAGLPTIADMSNPQNRKAVATRQPVESASRAFSSGHTTSIESKGADTSNLRRRGPLVKSSPLPGAESLAKPSVLGVMVMRPNEDSLNYAARMAAKEAKAGASMGRLKMLRWRA